MNGTRVAIRYAEALYDVASRKEMVDIIADDLSKLDMIMSEAHPIRDYCLKSHASRVSEMMFVNTAFVPYVSQMVGEILKIAVRNGRLAVMPYLCTAFHKIVENKSGITEVTLESARVPEGNLLEKIEKKIEMHIGGKIKLKHFIVPELLGGIRILWDNRMIDLSAIGRLKKMRAFIKAA